MPADATTAATTFEGEVLAHCHRASLALLERNLAPGGILAATPGARAEARSYTRVFGRDAAICVLAMAGSGVPKLEQGAIDSLDALAAGQAPNGQIPKFVSPEGDEADFWYLGCIDATLWWLIAVDHVRRVRTEHSARWAGEVHLALQWLLAQEHQRMHLLQQNEASDWADIMPRSGFVLYTNALWHHVKQRFGLPNAESTREHADSLFYPRQHALPDYRRVRLLSHYVRRGQRDPGLYLSFVNLGFAGDEGDVLGNVLALLWGLADARMADRIIETLLAAGAAHPIPARSVLRPIGRTHPLWRPYMARHRQNYPQHYHNGGIWPFIGGFWVMGLARQGRAERARADLIALARANLRDGERFTEWFEGESLRPLGMAGQTWNAATYLLAERELGLD